MKLREFEIYDSVQVTTYHNNGTISIRRGLLFKMEDNGMYYTYLPTSNSMLSNIKYGSYNFTPSDLIPHNERRAMFSICLCRIVLMEKSICNTKVSYHIV